jgi:anti-sigma B factor antagonist
MAMKITIVTMKRCELVTVSGQIDSASAPELEQALVGLIDGGKKHLVVNLRDVDFVTSAGLSALLAARIKLRRKTPPGDVVISEVSDLLMETFELVGFHHVFTFYDADAEAVGNF